MNGIAARCGDAEGKSLVATAGIANEISAQSSEVCIPGLLTVNKGGTAIYVDPKTVGQFTGLTDKNGKRIFEGDIIECWSEGVKAKGTVQQRKDGLWIIYPAWQKTITWGLCPDEYCHTTVEVIGNIHDNPELLD